MQIPWHDWIYPIVCVAVPSAWAAGATVFFRHLDRSRVVGDDRRAAERAHPDGAPSSDYSI